MLEKINLHGLELMQRYPNDLIVHDRAILDRVAYPGALVAWVVGDSHTHIVALGLHPKENEAVTYFTNLSRTDRFYTLSITAAAFSLKEIDRAAFLGLQTTSVPYTRTGTAQSFYLFRNDDRIGHCRITRSGDYQSLKYTATITPIHGITEIDNAALFSWASHAVTEISQTLFAKSEFIWTEPLKSAA